MSLLAVVSILYSCGPDMDVFPSCCRTYKLQHLDSGDQLTLYSIMSSKIN